MFSADQYRAALQNAVVVDSTRSAIVLTGTDRRSFLHGLLTNDIAALVPGTGTYAAYLTPQGRMISDMRVMETGSDIVLAVERDAAASLAARLDRLVFSEDVQVRDVAGEIAGLEVIGPLARQVLGRAGSSALKPYENWRTGEGDLVVYEPLGALDAFAIFVAAHRAGDWTSRLEAAGAGTADADIAEALRVEAGVPRFGLDMDHETIPLEAGLESRAISTTKGCYVGQEVIVRVLHRGHGRVAKRLVSLLVSGARIPAHGDPIALSGQEIGRVTSAVFSPALNSPLALGYVQRESAEPGVIVAINNGTEPLEARVGQVI